VAEAGRRSRLRLRRLESRGLLSCVVVIVDSGGGSTICRAILPNAVVARRVLRRTRAEVASLRIAVESRMSRSRRWPPGGRVGPGRPRGRGGSCGRHPRVDAVVVVDRRRSRSSWRFVTHVIVWRCPTDIRCFQDSNNCSPPEHPQLLGCRVARGIRELFSCLFFVLFLVSKLSWLVRNIKTACKQIQRSRCAGEETPKGR